MVPEGRDDGPTIELLLDLAFGPERRRKTSYRYRAGIAPIAGLCLTVRDGARLVGSIRHWPIRLDELPALLLGPLAIDPGEQGRGIGRRLIADSLRLAEAAGWRLVFLVGDPAYYGQRGFSMVPATVLMPGEDPGRVQYLTLAGAELPGRGGILLRADAGPAVEPVEQRVADHRHPLVGAHAGLHRPQPLGHGGRLDRTDGLGQRVDQGADGEQDRAGPRQPPQRLPLDA